MPSANGVKLRFPSQIYSTVVRDLSRSHRHAARMFSVRARSCFLRWITCLLLTKITSPTIASGRLRFTTDWAAYLSEISGGARVIVVYAPHG